MNRTEISSLGEFGLIDRIKQPLVTNHPSTVLGIGDDAAVIDIGDEYLIISSDMLVEGVHFDLSYCPLQHLGYKAAVSNFSDMAAMNGFPTQFTVSLALSSRISVEAVDALYEGFKHACANYNVDLVGGDTTSSRSGLVISITVVGRVPKKCISYRKGAQVNDIVCVTGDLGGAYLGYQILEREKRIFLEHPDTQPELKGYDYVLGKQLRPEARTDMVHTFRELGLVPTSMIDVSDGLASEILHICKQSGVGVRLFDDKLPLHTDTVSAARDLNLSTTTCAMNGGEDYELLFTVSQSDYDKIKVQADITTIGYITKAEEGAFLITKSGQQLPITAQGWQHF